MGSEEVVPETSVFLSMETRMPGNFVGRIKGAITVATSNS